MEFDKMQGMIDACLSQVLRMESFSTTFEKPESNTVLRASQFGTCPLKRRWFEERGGEEHSLKSQWKMTQGSLAEHMLVDAMRAAGNKVENNLYVERGNVSGHIDIVLNDSIVIEVKTSQFPALREHYVYQTIVYGYVTKWEYDNYFLLLFDMKDLSFTLYEIVRKEKSYLVKNGRDSVIMEIPGSEFIGEYLMQQEYTKNPENTDTPEPYKTMYNSDRFWECSANKSIPSQTAKADTGYFQITCPVNCHGLDTTKRYRLKRTEKGGQWTCLDIDTQEQPKETS